VHRKLEGRAWRFIGSSIDFKNAFDAMTQAVLWQAMQMFYIPDVDLLEQRRRHLGYTPNNEECTTITFKTGVAQGTIMSP